MSEPATPLRETLTRLMRDHYWDSLEPQKELVMAHVEFVLSYAKNLDYAYPALVADRKRLVEALRALTPDPHDEGLILTHDELKAADLLAELDGGKT